MNCTFNIEGLAGKSESASTSVNIAPDRKPSQADAKEGVVGVKSRDFTHPIKEDVKKKFFSVPLEGT